MDLNEVAIFIKVIQTGSFSTAAKRLNMPVSTVSHKVASLEKRLGLTLIQRSTRRLSITPVGEQYFKRCLEGLAGIEAAEAEIASSGSMPTGFLKITAPFEMGVVLGDIATGFMDRFPKVGVEILLTDRRVDLLSEGVDLAIRAGELKDSSLIAKKIGTSWFAVYASPDYLKANPAPKHPREIIEHRCLQFAPLGLESWSLTGPGGAIRAAVPGRLLVNDLGCVSDLAINGKGLALLPNFAVHEELAEKRLVRVLPDWRSAALPTHFVYPSQRFVSTKLSEFIKFAEPAMKKMFEGESLDARSKKEKSLVAKLGARNRNTGPK